MKSILLGAITMSVLSSSVSAHAQSQTPAPIQLDDLQRAALARDPRTRELPLQDAQSDLRLRNIQAERLPSLAVQGQLQYQSDVPTAPLAGPTGQPLFAPPKDTYDAFLRVDQHLLDPTIGPRMAAERAQLAESQARVRTTLFALRQEVNDAFFAAALLEQQDGALLSAISQLESLLKETRARVQEGSAVPSDAAAVEATLLQRRQDESSVQGRRVAALNRLGLLTGRNIGLGDVLAIPDLADAVAPVGASRASVRERPEYEQFQRTRERLERQQESVAASQRPSVSAFARAGYGKPGLNFISDRFETYGLGGVQVQWKGWSWGSTGREQEALALQQQIVEADETAFTDTLTRATQADLDTIGWMRNRLEMDDQIISLREVVMQTALARFNEGVVTGSELSDRNNELVAARIARATHLVELAQARAHLLTLLGMEVR